MSESDSQSRHAEPGYTEIILQLDLNGRPMQRPESIDERPEYIRQQKEWFETLSIPAIESLRKLGCKVLEQTWITAEMVVAVPDEGFEEKISDLLSTTGVVDYYVEYGTLEPEAPDTPD